MNISVNVYYAPVETIWGTFLLASTDKGLCQLHYLQNNEEQFFSWLNKKFSTGGELNLKKNQDAAKELNEYLQGKRKNFETPLDLRGTNFQLAVWEELRKIPYGEVTTYGKIASLIGNPKSARAVGMANHNNPLLIMVPCHRVIGSDGSLTGFGCGLELKLRLLELEKSF